MQVRFFSSLNVAYETTGTSVSNTPGKFSATRGASRSLNLTKRDLMTPDEVMRLDPTFELLLQPGEAPVAGIKLRHYADAEFQGLFDPA